MLSGELRLECRVAHLLSVHKTPKVPSSKGDIVFLEGLMLTSCTERIKTLFWDSTHGDFYPEEKEP